MEDNQIDSLDFLSCYPEPLSYNYSAIEGVQLPSSNEGESIADGAEAIPHSPQHLDGVEEDLPEVNENHEPHTGLKVQFLNSR